MRSDVGISRTLRQALPAAESERARRMALMLTFKLWRRAVNLGEITHPKSQSTGRKLRIDLPQFREHKTEWETR